MERSGADTRLKSKRRFCVDLCTQVWAVLLRDRLLLTSPDSENLSVLIENTVFLHDVVSHDFTRPYGLPHLKPTPVIND